MSRSRLGALISSPSHTVHRLALLPARHHLPGLAPQRPRIRPRYEFITPSKLPAARASFHSTRRNQVLPAGPLIPLIASILKTSTALEVARTAARIGLTFVPIILVKNHKSRMRVLSGTTRHGQPIPNEKKDEVLARIKHRTAFLKIMLLVPFVLFWGTIIASLERTPLTGRWRMIILSPEEESEIAAQLAGPGWYRAVGNILAEEGTPRCVPSSDWRYIWVNETLRKLEATIPILAREPELCPDWYQDDADGDEKLMPPPAEFPLRPRPRASEYLKSFCETLTEQKHPHPISHTIPGPPYSLLVVDNPETQNAFSYGFGPDGGGGIVVYSGFLDDIFARMPPAYEQPETPSTRSWWSWLFGNLFSPVSPAASHPTPTREQTSELAILLAHELSHLILSHHLETLSSGTVIVPGVLSIISDVVRVVVFPITMLFGPFVNDAVAQLGKVGSVELGKLGQHCTSMKQEIEADVVSARLLAHAGFDARDAVRFWETRGAMSECSSPRSSKLEAVDGASPLARNIMGATHPVNEVRIESLKQELLRWEDAKTRALTQARREESIAAS